MPPALPERFGNYELIERLGVGGMAETFLAIRRGLGGFEQRVCVKRILPSFAGDPEFVAMFQREARLSALLHHGHIARVLDFGTVDAAHYLALELVEGSDLRFVLRHFRRRGEGLDGGLTSYIAHALASALDYAHATDREGVSAGSVHRDISPSNVLLSPAGELKLTDFGIATALSRPGSAQSNALKGKIPYMAPEYALGRRSGPRTDLFSLGVLLYECLAGFRPFDGGHDLQTIEHARNGQREPLQPLAPNAPPALVDAVEALLEPQPEGRPLDAAALLERLDACPPPALARRHLGALVTSLDGSEGLTSLPGVAKTRPAPTQRPRRRLPSRA